MKNIHRYIFSQIASLSKMDILFIAFAVMATILTVTTSSPASFLYKDTELSPASIVRLNKLLNGSFVLTTFAALTIFLQARKNSKVANDYIFIEIPDNFRGLFQDMMRGFEDYCSINGFDIKVSIDNGFENKIAFKISYNENDNFKEEDIREQFRTYKEKLSKYNGFSDIEPHTTKQFRHLLQLQNRINLLENDKRNLEQMLKWQERTFDKIMDKELKIYPQAPSTVNINVESNNESSSGNFDAKNGGNIVIGNNNTTSISISNSFNKRKEQVAKIDELIVLLKHEASINKEKLHILEEALTDLYQIKGALQDEDNPDEVKILKWLMRAKGIVEKFVLTHDAAETLQWILKSFGIN